MKQPTGLCQGLQGQDFSHLRVINQAFDLVFPLRCPPGKKNVFVVRQNIFEGLGWAHHGNQATQAEFHPTVGTFGIGEHTRFQHHQSNIVLGDGTDVIGVSERSLMLDALMVLQKHERSANLTQQ